MKTLIAFVLLVVSTSVAANPWNYSRIVDVMTDKVLHTTVIHGDYNGYLTIACIEDKNRVRIWATIDDAYARYEKIHKMMVRIDDNKPMELRGVSVGSDRTTVSYFGSGAEVDLAKQLIGAKKIIVRAGTYKVGTLTISDISDDSNITTVLNGCAS